MRNNSHNSLPHLKQYLDSLTNLEVWQRGQVSKVSNPACLGVDFCLFSVIAMLSSIGERLLGCREAKK
jgi:hypothetical protein